MSDLALLDAPSLDATLTSEDSGLKPVLTIVRPTTWYIITAPEATERCPLGTMANHSIRHCPPVRKCRRVRIRRMEILHLAPDAQALGVREVAATPPTPSSVTSIPQSFVNVVGRKVCCP